MTICTRCGKTMDPAGTCPGCGPRGAAMPAGRADHRVAFHPSARAAAPRLGPDPFATMVDAVPAVFRGDGAAPAAPAAPEGAAPLSWAALFGAGTGAPAPGPDPFTTSPGVEPLATAPTVARSARDAMSAPPGEGPRPRPAPEDAGLPERMQPREPAGASMDASGRDGNTLPLRMRARVPDEAAAPGRPQTPDRALRAVPPEAQPEPAPAAAPRSAAAPNPELFPMISLDADWDDAEPEGPEPDRPEAAEAPEPPGRVSDEWSRLDWQRATSDVPDVSWERLDDDADEPIGEDPAEWAAAAAGDEDEGSGAEAVPSGGQEPRPAPPSAPPPPAAAVAPDPGVPTRPVGRAPTTRRTRAAAPGAPPAPGATPTRPVSGAPEPDRGASVTALDVDMGEDATPAPPSGGAMRASVPTDRIRLDGTLRSTSGVTVPRYRARSVMVALGVILLLAAGAGLDYSIAASRAERFQSSFAGEVLDYGLWAEAELSRKALAAVVASYCEREGAACETPDTWVRSVDPRTLTRPPPTRWAGNFAARPYEYGVRLRAQVHGLLVFSRAVEIDVQRTGMFHPDNLVGPQTE